MNRDLEGRVAVVTGAGPGIGRAVALRLARDGADVVIAARRAGPLETLAAAIEEETGRRVLAVPTDVKDLAACDALVERTIEAFGRVDALVNNATHPFERVRVEETDWSDFDDSIQLNVKGTMRLCGAATQHMAAVGGGAIVNIGTLSTSSWMPKNVTYTASKAAMVAASKTMAREVGARHVRVNVVTPGFTTGEDLDRLFEKMAEGAGSTPEQMSRRLAREAALERHVDPEDIAEAVLFLASDRARNITGIELHVTAGALFR